jgi:hypothetical protein
MDRHVASQPRHMAVCDGRVRASRHITPPLRGVTCDGDDTALSRHAVLNPYRRMRAVTARWVKKRHGQVKVLGNLGMRRASRATSWG